MLEELVGEQLSAVTFVQDYLQLAFDGPVLTAVTWPVVTTGERKLRIGERDYRDELCARIARLVKSATCSDEEIRLSFDDGALFSISLRVEDLEGRSAESATYVGKNGRMMVFRPGE